MNDLLQLVSYEQAIRLKQSGFNWRCVAFYRNEVLYDKTYADISNTSYRFVCCNKDNDGPTTATAPTVALALKWMREVIEVVSCVNTNQDGFKYWGCYIQSYAWKYTDDCDTYEEAESALLDELLTLIEKS
jgi:hypothetical protein